MPLYFEEKKIYENHLSVREIRNGRIRTCNTQSCYRRLLLPCPFGYVPKRAAVTAHYPRPGTCSLKFIHCQLIPPPDWAGLDFSNLATHTRRNAGCLVVSMTVVMFLIGQGSNVTTK